VLLAHNLYKLFKTPKPLDEAENPHFEEVIEELKQIMVLRSTHVGQNLWVVLREIKDEYVGSIGRLADTNSESTNEEDDT
jgi:hypothetical protein